MPEIKTRADRPLEDSSVAVGEIMNTEVESIEPNATASFAWSEMRRRGIGQSGGHGIRTIARGRFSTRFWAAYERCHSDGAHGSRSDDANRCKR